MFDAENAVLKYAEQHETTMFDEWSEIEWETLINDIESSGQETWTDAEWQEFKSNAKAMAWRFENLKSLDQI